MTYSDLFDNPTQESLFTVRYSSFEDGEVIEYYDTVGEAADEASSMEDVHGWEVEEMISPDGLSFKWSEGEFIKMGVAFDELEEYIDDMGRELWEDMDSEACEILF
jgi:hypothetical protein